MKNSDEINDNINELILQKSFDELSANEKAKAIEYAGSEEQYNTLRSTLMAITTSFGDEVDDVAEDKAMKNDLMNRFKQKHGEHVKDTKVIPIYRKPLFQLAVAASLTLLIVFSFPLFNNMNKSEQLAKLDVDKTGENDKTAPAETLAATNALSSETENKNNTLSENLLSEEESNISEDVPAGIKPDDILSDRKVEYNDKEALAEEVQKTSSIERNNLEEKTVLSSNKGENLKRDRDKDASISDIVTAPTTTNNTVTYSGSNSQNTRNDKSKAEKKKTKDEALAGIAEDESPAPAKPAFSNTMNFVENNKTEILDLMFTVY